ncbi:helix-turn-helix domain-containing protein [Ornithinimicrobium cavernae]|uniref:helix-turn-helix domain-containing protein n=1 Tax=Ornithinimicrobium cavernae TaxID=2666047 RepID=UPI000D690EE7|nr:helix-turn-helix transcriptional regulator [Ornithinimicrobium cavernae]
MDVEDEYWLVGGGEPGASRFGQMAQRLRQEINMSVDQVAKEAGLSAGTIRAVEQGRRAPSEKSGVRILKVLMPDTPLTRQVEGGPERDQSLTDYSFTHPHTGGRVLLKFKAKTAGDNQRWSSARSPVGSSGLEARLLELTSDPHWQEKFRSSMAPGLGRLSAALTTVKESAERPASDATYGSLTRRFAGTSEYRARLIGHLLDLWQHVDSDDGDPKTRAVARRIEHLLDSHHTFLTEGFWVEAEGSATDG